MQQVFIEQLLCRSHRACYWRCRNTNCSPYPWEVHCMVHIQRQNSTAYSKEPYLEQYKVIIKYYIALLQGSLEKK